MIAQIIITSVLFAFVQHFETTYRDRLRAAQDRIQKDDAREHLDKALPGGEILRDELDIIDNGELPGTALRKISFLKIPIYLLFLFLVILMGLTEVGYPWTWGSDNLPEEGGSAPPGDSFARSSWIAMVSMALTAGGLMLLSGVRIVRFEERVKKVSIWLDGASAGSNTLTEKQRRRRLRKITKKRKQRPGSRSP